MLPTVNPVKGFNPTGCLTFRFTSNSSGTNQGWAASISCYEVSSCPRPIELSQLPINSENVQVDWTETGFATNWEIELGDLGFTTTGIPTHTTAIKPYTLTNLNPGQQYSLYIRSICTQEESEWTGPYIITTPPSLCLGSIQTGSNAIPNDGSIVTNSNIVAGNYTRFTDITSEDLYTFESSINSDWLIITNESNTLLAQGNSPLNWTATMDGNIRVHIFVNIFCDTNASLRNISTHCVSCLPPVPNCVTISEPSNGEVNVLRPVLLQWNHPTTGPIPTHYDLYLGNTINSFNQTIILTYPASGVYLTGTSANTTYYWRIVPRNANGSATNCEVWNFTTLGTPPNDDCNNAINLEEGISIAGTTVGGTQSYPACVGNSNDDVFYTFETKLQGGPFVITVQPTLNDFDPVVELLASCGGTSLVCQNNNGNGETEIINYTGVGNSTYYIRVHSSGTNSSRFTIKVEGEVLPIEIISLKAFERGDNNIIEWVTSSEVNNEFQIVEKTNKDSGNWVEVGKVSGTNTKDTTIRYEITDYAPSQVEYYRIKSIDFDGSIQYSKIISLVRSNHSITSMVKSIYPNPVNQEMTISITSEMEDDIEIRIVDITGKVLLQQNHSLVLGENKLIVGLSNLPSGAYFTHITGNRLNVVEKIIKQ